MKNKYEKIGEFIADVMTEETIKIARESSSFCHKPDSEHYFNLGEFRHIVEDLENYEHSSYKRKGLATPFRVVNCEANSETDHDHGAWTDTYVLDINGRFYEIELDFYGQGHFHIEESVWKGVHEVTPVQVTITKYVRKTTA